jgi:hypothetical protein
MGVNAVTTTFDFTSGQILTAAQMDNVNCGVPVFASEATRDDAFDGAGEKVLAEGQTCYIEALDRFQVYDGSVFRSIFLGGWTAYTPTVGSVTGTITTKSGTGAYVLIGKMLVARFNLTITTNGTGATGVTMTLPFNQSGAYVNNQTIGFAREGTVTGNFLQVGTSTAGVATIRTATNGYPGGDGTSMIGSMFYEVA